MATQSAHSNLFVRNIPPEYDQAAVEQLFRQFGAIVGCRYFKTAPVPYAFIKLSTIEEASAAVTGLNNVTVGGKQLMVKIADVDHEYDVPNNNLYLKNLPVAWNEETVRQHFSPYGDVISVKMLPVLPNANSQGAMVRMGTIDQAKAAREALNAIIPQGETLSMIVKYADTPNEKARKIAKMSGKLGNRFAPYPQLAKANSGNPFSIDPLAAAAFAAIAMQPFPDDPLTAAAFAAAGLPLPSLTQQSSLHSQLSQQPPQSAFSYDLNQQPSQQAPLGQQQQQQQPLQPPQPVGYLQSGQNGPPLPYPTPPCDPHAHQASQAGQHEGYPTAPGPGAGFHDPNQYQYQYQHQPQPQSQQPPQQQQQPPSTYPPSSSSSAPMPPGLGLDPYTGYSTHTNFGAHTSYTAPPPTTNGHGQAPPASSTPTPPAPYAPSTYDAQAYTQQPTTSGAPYASAYPPSSVAPATAPPHGWGGAPYNGTPAALGYPPSAAPAGPGAQAAAAVAGPQAEVHGPTGIIVKGLPTDVDRLMMYEMFAPCGPTLSVSIAPGGVGHVTYGDLASALKAVQYMDNNKLGPHTLVVALQQPSHAAAGPAPAAPAPAGPAGYSAGGSGLPY